MHFHFCEECKEIWACHCEDYVEDYNLLCDEHSPDVSFMADGEFLKKLKKRLDEERRKMDDEDPDLL